MRICFFISLAAHVSLLLFGYFANISTPESSEIEFEFSDVSIVELDDWVAMTTPAPVPAVEPTQLSRPDVLDQDVPAPAIPISEPTVTKPEIPPSPTISAVAPAAPPRPEFAVPSTPAPTLPPRMQAPEVVAPPPSPPPPEPEEAPEVEEPAEQAAPKVSSEAAPEAEPDVVQDDEVKVATSPDDSTEATQSEEVEQSTAPEHTATKIVTEADDAEERRATVPIRRPSYVASRVDSPSELETTAVDVGEESEPEDNTEEDPEDPSSSTVPDQTEIDSLIEESQLAQVESAEEQDSSTDPLLAVSDGGAPIPSSVSEGLRSAIRDCWNVGALSTAALRTVLTVGFSLNRDGTLKVESVKLVDAQSESEIAESRAFEVARRAIICGLGKDLEFPPESYSRWQNIEMRFDPEQMRFK